MIELIDLQSEKAVGLRMDGKIEKEDMDTIIKATEGKFGNNKKLSFYVEVDSFDGISFEALLKDLKFGLPNIGRFAKKAVVSNIKWQETAALISNKIFPFIEVRHFSPEHKEEAKAWILAD